MVTIPVDYNRWGPSPSVRVWLAGDEPELLCVGDPVTVPAVEEIPERCAVVVELAPDGSTAVIEFKDPWPN
jgi:hypothetical protein